MSEHDCAALLNFPPEIFECIVGHYVTMVGIHVAWESRKACRISTMSNRFLRTYADEVRNPLCIHQD